MPVSSWCYGNDGARRWLAVTSLFSAAFMNILDVTIVNLALPAIQMQFNASSTDLEWVLIIYVLTFAAGLLPFGRFGDAFGRRRIFILGVGGFATSSLICGTAADIETLIFARAFQGLAGALMVPQVLAIVHVMFTAEEKGTVIGLFGAISGLGAISGPLVGGVLISLDIAGLGWRSIFLLNIPLSLFSMIGAMRFVPEIRTSDQIKVDWGGAVLFALIVGAVIYPLVEGRHLEWPWWCFALMAMSVVLAMLFVSLQAGRAARDLPQILPVGLLRDRSFVVGLLTVAAFFSGVAGVFFMLTIFLQSGFGMSPLEAGLTTAPHPLAAMIASYLTGRIGSRWLDVRIAVGAAVLLIGMLWVQAVLANIENAISVTDLLFPLLAVGAGIGTAAAAVFQNVLGRVSGQDAGAGSGVLQAFQQVGIAVGIAVTGQFFFSSLEQAHNRSAYADAAQVAMIFPIVIYLMLTVGCFWAIRKREYRT